MSHSRRRFARCVCCGDLKRIEVRGLCSACALRRDRECPVCGCGMYRAAPMCCFCKIERAVRKLVATGCGTRGCPRCRGEMARELARVREHAKWAA